MSGSPLPITNKARCSTRTPRAARDDTPHEFCGAAAGFGKADGSRPSFFLEAGGEPVRGRLHIALRAENRAQVDAFHAAAVEAGGTDNGAPGLRWYHPEYYAATSSTPTGTTSRPSATKRNRTAGRLGQCSRMSSEGCEAGGDGRPIEAAGSRSRGAARHDAIDIGRAALLPLRCSTATGDHRSDHSCVAASRRGPL